MDRAVAIDFGTTNSAIAVVGSDGQPRLARFAHEDLMVETFRSILFFSSEAAAPGHPSSAFAGPSAIQEYLASGGSGRLIQSLKSFLADKLFDTTTIFDRPYQLSELVSLILIALRAAGEAQFGDLGRRVVVGRPIRFVGASNQLEDALALRRLTMAVRSAGFGQVSFEYEPVGAAYHYARRLVRDELVLIADFGGGTSDFSLLRLHTRRAGKSASRFEILGNDGVAVAGDAFDGRIIRHLVAPALGRDARYRSPYGKSLPGPVWLYSKLERWHHLSFLKAPRIMARLSDLQRDSLEPEKIQALIHTVQNDLGYQLFKAVERLKIELSCGERSSFEFFDPPVAISKPVTCAEFESWIAKELSALAVCVDRLLAQCKIAPEQVDTVFMTGGSSFVTAVRRLFEERFGMERIRAGDELTSVASGLALVAQAAGA